MTQTLTATPDTSYTPPRVRLDFSDTGSSPATSVTITRQNASGKSYTVRTSDGEPLPVSGGVATVWDYEVPFGQTVTYTTDITNGPTATAVLDVSAVWLVHPGVPSRSVAVDLRAGTNDSEDWDIVQGSFTVLSRSTPIITTGGARVAPATTLVVRTSTQAERDALKLLLSDGSPLYLNVPSSLGIGVDTAYIAVGKVTAARPSGAAGTDWARDVQMPYQVVARPGGGTQAATTWDVVAGQYATWSALAATKKTWAQLVAPTS